MIADNPRDGSAEPEDMPDAELEDALGEEDAADAAEGEAIIPGLPHGLLPRQKIWAERWVTHWNGTLAAKEAGYGGSKKTLGVRAARNKRNPKIISYIGLLLCPDVDKIDAAYLKRRLLNETLSAPHSRDRLKGLELLGRSIGALTDVHEHRIGRPSGALLAELAKTQPEFAAQLAPLLGVEWPPAGKACGPPESITPPAKA